MATCSCRLTGNSLRFKYFYFGETHCIIKFSLENIFLSCNLMWNLHLFLNSCSDTLHLIWLWYLTTYAKKIVSIFLTLVSLLCDNQMLILPLRRNMLLLGWHYCLKIRPISLAAQQVDKLRYFYKTNLYIRSIINKTNSTLFHLWDLKYSYSFK